jgi:hypothetical protein
MFTSGPLEMWLSSAMCPPPFPKHSGGRPGSPRCRGTSLLAQCTVRTRTTMLHAQASRRQGFTIGRLAALAPTKTAYGRTLIDDPASASGRISGPGTKARESTALVTLGFPRTGGQRFDVCRNKRLQSRPKPPSAGQKAEEVSPSSILTLATAMPASARRLSGTR